MQGEPKPHIGLPEGAPAEVKWSSKSFLKPVEQFEEFNLRPYVLFVSFCWMPLIIAGLIILQWHKLAAEGSEIDKFRFAGMCLILVGVADLFLHGHLLKYILIRKVGHRQGRLFEPDWKSIFVHIEDSKTFNKMKLISNDFGLLRAHNGYIDMEMTTHRAHLASKNVSVLIHSLTEKKDQKKGISGVQLASKAGEWFWAVTLIAPVQNWNLLLGVSNNKRATWLLKRIQKDVNSGRDDDSRAKGSRSMQNKPEKEEIDFS
jgi:hypothetical protein